MSTLRRREQIARAGKKWRLSNKSYYNAWQRAFRKTPEGRRHVRAMNLKKYGLTPEQYDELYVLQGGVCASCGKKETARNMYGEVSLAVDHCHITNKIRGLLCMCCNRALGLIGDDLESARKLVNYLERNQ